MPWRSASMRILHLAPRRFHLFEQAPERSAAHLFITHLVFYCELIGICLQTLHHIKMRDISVPDKRSLAQDPSPITPPLVGANFNHRDRRVTAFCRADTIGALELAASQQRARQDSYKPSMADDHNAARSAGWLHRAHVGQDSARPPSDRACPESTCTLPIRLGIVSTRRKWCSLQFTTELPSVTELSSLQKSR
jgi:hypothetical protein